MDIYKIVKLNGLGLYIVEYVAVVLDNLLIQTMLFRLKLTRIQVIKRAITELKSSINKNYEDKVQTLKTEVIGAKTRKDRLLKYIYVGY